MGGKSFEHNANLAASDTHDRDKVEWGLGGGRVRPPWIIHDPFAFWLLPVVCFGKANDCNLLW